MNPFGVIIFISNFIFIVTLSLSKCIFYMPTTSYWISIIILYKVC